MQAGVAKRRKFEHICLFDCNWVVHMDIFMTKKVREVDVYHNHMLTDKYTPRLRAYHHRTLSCGTGPAAKQQNQRGAHEGFAQNLSKSISIAFFESVTRVCSALTQTLNLNRHTRAHSHYLHLHLPHWGTSTGQQQTTRQTRQHRERLGGAVLC